ncbi:polysaccharide biosynthesis tyrosine autokinase [Flavobacteriaceae bacterium R38]|nr:polysaccharide biosynthesis tyrosine autokinase [Flavobacteriaceae bacterium R38]
MTSNKINSNINSEVSDSVDLRKVIGTYSRHWKWFLLSLIVCISLAYLKLRYATPKYAASAKIILLDDNNSSSPATALLRELDQYSNNEANKVEDEIRIMKSRKLMSDVVKKLDLNVRYSLKGRIHDAEFFQNTPLKLNFIVSDSIVYRSDLSFYVDILSNDEFNYRRTEKDTPKKISFGDNIPSSIGGMVLTPTINNIDKFKGSTFKIKISNVDRVAESYKNAIRISPADKFSKVINISLEDPVKIKAQKIIDELVNQYNETSINQKNLESKKTADFINERIDLIATDLSDVDKNAERFKTGNRLTDITSEADIYLNSGSLNDEQLSASRTELNLINYMKSYLDDIGDGYDPIPSNVGLSDPSILNITARYNELIFERQRLLKSSNDKNPIIVRLNQQLSGLKQSMRQSLENLRNTLSIRVNNLQQQSARINSKISSVPGQERQLRDIQRQQQIKESLYLFLLEKREEATISLTATSPSAKFVDKAYSPIEGPISPKPKMIFLTSIFLGLVIPFSVIYVKDLLNNKIQNKEGLEKELKTIPILGEIPKLKGKNKDSLIERNDRSVLSESFRIIRTNFDYLQRVRKTQKYNNVIFVTSTIKGEGKTFFSMNMALTFANSDKRVLLIGADIRNPRLHTLLNNNKQKKKGKYGLTDYLFDHSLDVKDVIEDFELNKNKIDILLPGKIPPNPAELLMSSRMETLFDEVSRDYDIVIVDTAPSLLVTDTLLFSQYAGHTVYLVRADYTEKNLLSFPKELHQDGKLNGMMTVINGVKLSNFSYGAKYGYGYGDTSKKKSKMKLLKGA